VLTLLHGELRLVPIVVRAEMITTEIGARRYLESLEASRQVSGRNYYYLVAREAACYASVGSMKRAFGLLKHYG